jgi:hypothetical protein
MGGIASGDKTFRNYSIRPNDLVQVAQGIFYDFGRGENLRSGLSKGGTGCRGARGRGCADARG